MFTIAVYISKANILLYMYHSLILKFVLSTIVNAAVSKIFTTIIYLKIK